MTHAVAIAHQDRTTYPETPPYHPDTAYPELRAAGHLGGSNPVYASVRQLLHLLGLDAPRFGQSDWNPLGFLIRPGQTVFIKPNMIAHKHSLCDDWDYVITHGSVVRAVVDYVHIALQGRGRMLIGDAPQTDSRFDLIVERMGLAALKQFYADVHGFEIDVLDLRDEFWVEKDGIYTETVKLPGDPRGRVEVDLADRSFFAELDGRDKRYYGAFYDTDETNRHHRDGCHEYAISRTPIEADVFLNVPKLKTHKKCGITVNLKGLVGINADKNWLPHYCIGSPEEGGDQFPGDGLKGRLENRFVLEMKKHLVRGNPLALLAARKLKQVGYRIFGSTEEVVRSGNWHGNDTAWRMSADLNRILMYANPDGTLRTGDRPKLFFSIVDGILGMEGNGPVAGNPKAAGVVVGGGNPVAVDAVCAAMMGFDFRKMPLIHRSMAPHPLPLFEGSADEIMVESNRDAWKGPLGGWRRETSLEFRPHFGWVGNLEWV